MLIFFLKHKKVRGAITMFLTIIYMATYFMTGALVDGGRIKIGHTIIEDAQQIATENIMAQYNKGLYELYGLFGTSGYSPEEIETSIKAQMEEILNFKLPDSVLKSLSASEGADLSADLANRFDPFNIKIEDIDVNGLSLTADNIDLIRAQMRDDIKYDGYKVIVDAIMPVVQMKMKIRGFWDTLKTVFELMSDNTKNGINKKIEQEEKKFSDNYRKMLNSFYKGGDGEIKKVKLTTDSSRLSLLDALGIAGSTVGSIGGSIGESFSNFIDSDGEVGLFEGLSEISLEDNLIKQLINSDEDNESSNRDAFNNLKQFMNNNQSQFYKDFDSESGWPNKNDKKYKSSSESEDDDEDEENYNDDEEANSEDSEDKEQLFISDVKKCAEERKNKLTKAVDNLEQLVDDASNSLENTCTEYKKLIESTNSLLIKLVNLCNEKEAESSRVNLCSLSILAGQIHSNLAAWKSTLERMHKLENVQELLNYIKEDIKSVGEDIEEIYQEITADVDSEKFSWAYKNSYKLGNRESVKSIHEDFGRSVDELAIQDQYIDVFKYIMLMLLYFSKIVNKINKSQTVNGKGFQGILRDIKKETNIFKYSIDPADSSETSASNSEKDFELLGFVLELLGDNAIDTFIRWIMSAYNDIVAPFKASITDDYEASYILTHCRDFAHTYWYNEKVTKRSNTEQEVEKTIADHFWGGVRFLGSLASGAAEVVVMGISKGFKELSKLFSGDKDNFGEEWTKSMNKVMTKYTDIIIDNFVEICNPYMITNPQYDTDSDLDYIANNLFTSDNKEGRLLSKDDLKNKDNEEWEIPPIEIEYILSNRKSNETNNYKIVELMWQRIFINRCFLNYAAAWSSPACILDMINISSKAGDPVVMALISCFIPLIYALPESYLEADLIMRCKKINLFNGLSNIRLWTGFLDCIMTFLEKSDFEEASSEMNKIIEKLCAISNNEHTINDFIDEVEAMSYSEENSDGVRSGTKKLEHLIEIEAYDSLTVDTNGWSEEKIVLDTKVVNESVADILTTIATDMASSAFGPIGYEPRSLGPIEWVQVGYTYYLYTFLVSQATSDKKEQRDQLIKRLLDVIETNMRKGQNKDFRLKDTYSQISAETKSSMKYIFMTQSFVKQLLEKKAINIGDRFSVTTKTAFGY